MVADGPQEIIICVPETIIRVSESIISALQIIISDRKAIISECISVIDGSHTIICGPDSIIGIHEAIMSVFETVISVAEIDFSKTDTIIYASLTSFLAAEIIISAAKKTAGHGAGLFLNREANSLSSPRSLILALGFLRSRDSRASRAYHLGDPSKAGFVVSLVSPVPSAFMR